VGEVAVWGSMSASASPATGGPHGAGRDDTKIGLLRVARGVVLFIYAVVLVNLVLLLLGFALRLFGASTDAAFTRWVYRNVDRIMEPFRGMFPTHPISGNSVLDVSLLFAMIVYMIVGITLHALVTWLAAQVVELRRSQRREALAVDAQPSAAAAGSYEQAAERTYRLK
jgi:uncharacterized protein YggT (Ycf19 family)